MAILFFLLNNSDQSQTVLIGQVTSRSRFEITRNKSSIIFLEKVGFYYFNMNSWIRMKELNLFKSDFF